MFEGYRRRLMSGTCLVTKERFSDMPCHVNFWIYTFALWHWLLWLIVSYTVRGPVFSGIDFCDSLFRILCVCRCSVALTSVTDCFVYCAWAGVHIFYNIRIILNSFFGATFLYINCFYTVYYELRCCTSSLSVLTNNGWYEAFGAKIKLHKGHYVVPVPDNPQQIILTVINRDIWHTIFSYSEL